MMHLPDTERSSRATTGHSWGATPRPDPRPLPGRFTADLSFRELPLVSGVGATTCCDGFPLTRTWPNNEVNAEEELGRITRIGDEFTVEVAAGKHVRHLLTEMEAHGDGA